jgi:hypothetical protein
VVGSFFLMYGLFAVVGVVLGAALRKLGIEIKIAP